MATLHMTEEKCNRCGKQFTKITGDIFLRVPDELKEKYFLFFASLCDECRKECVKNSAEFRGEIGYGKQK